MRTQTMDLSTPVERTVEKSVARLLVLRGDRWECGS